MGFSYAPDFVIRRKRKRSGQPTSPSVNLSTRISAPSAAENHDGQTVPVSCILPIGDVTDPTLEHDKPTTPAIAAHEAQHAPQEVTPVTVEDFLQWSTRTSTRHYTRQKRRRVQFHQDRGLSTQREHNACDSTYSGSGSSDYDTDHAPKGMHRGGSKKLGSSRKGRSLALTTQRARRQRKKDAFSKRLVTAAQLTQVEVDPVFRHKDAHIGSRPPLKFVPDQYEPLSGSAAWPDRGKRVDPRTTDPFDGAPSRSMFSADPPASPVLARAKRPVSGWRLQSYENVEAQSVTAPRRKGRASASDRGPERLDVIPLVLVPLEDEVDRRMKYLSSG